MSVSINRNKSFPLPVSPGDLANAITSLQKAGCQLKTSALRLLAWVDLTHGAFFSPDLPERPYQECSGKNLAQIRVPAELLSPWEIKTRRWRAAP